MPMGEMQIRRAGRQTWWALGRNHRGVGSGFGHGVEHVGSTRPQWGLRKLTWIGARATYMTPVDRVESCLVITTRPPQATHLDHDSQLGTQIKFEVPALVRPSDSLVNRRRPLNDQTGPKKIYYSAIISLWTGSIFRQFGLPLIPA
jgi:hypothetical protein